MTVCNHCGYEWTYGGEMQKATCPSCGAKTPVEENETATMRFDVHGLDVDDDEARDLADRLFVLLDDAGYDVKGVAPVLRERGGR